MRFKKWTTRNIIVGLIVFLSVVGVSGAVYNSKDPYVRQMMELQQAIVKKLHSFSTEAWVNMLCEKDVDDLQKAYNAYHDYYYQHYSNEEAV